MFNGVDPSINQPTNGKEHLCVACAQERPLMVFGFCLVGLEESLEVAIATQGAQENERTPKLEVG